jgi:hypothetical protein
MSFWTSAGSDCSTGEAASWVAPDENVYALVVRAVAMRSVFFIQSLHGATRFPRTARGVYTAYTLFIFIKPLRDAD